MTTVEEKLGRWLNAPARFNQAMSDRGIYPDRAYSYQVGGGYRPGIGGPEAIIRDALGPSASTISKRIITSYIQRHARLLMRMTGHCIYGTTYYDGRGKHAYWALMRDR